MTLLPAGVEYVKISPASSQGSLRYSQEPQKGCRRSNDHRRDLRGVNETHTGSPQTPSLSSSRKDNLFRHPLIRLI